MADRVTQLRVLSLSVPTPAARVTQAVVLSLVIESVATRVTQLRVLALTLQGEIEPEVGESFGPLVWDEWEGTDGTTRVWAPVDLPDPASYYFGYKPPKLLRAGTVVRALSDEQGEYQGQTFESTVIDVDRDLRGLLGQSDERRHFLNTRVVRRMISYADWRLKKIPRTVAIGLVRNYRLH